MIDMMLVSDVPKIMILLTTFLFTKIPSYLLSTFHSFLILITVLHYIIFTTFYCLIARNSSHNFHPEMIPLDSSESFVPRIAENWKVAL
jgi:hypothetical protein